MGLQKNHFPMSGKVKELVAGNNRKILSSLSNLP